MATETTNYGLHQWDPEDSFLRTDFNESFAKIDEALGVLASERIAVGSYVGDGSASRTISLPFTPQVLIISGQKQVSDYTRGLLTLVFGAYCHRFFAESNNVDGNIQIVEEGFEIQGDYHNDTGLEQRYLAIK